VRESIDGFAEQASPAACETQVFRLRYQYSAIGSEKIVEV
jgi:hypothetical protein